MSIRTVLVILLAIVCGLGAMSWASKLIQNSQAGAQDDTVPVVVAVDDIPALTKISRDMLRVVHYRKENAPKSAFATIEELVDRMAKEDLEKDWPIHDNRVTKKDEIGLAGILPRGWKTVRIANPNGLGGDIQRGNRLDGMLTISNDSGGSKGGITKTILKGVKILLVNDGVKQKDKLTSVMVQVTPKELAMLTLAQEKGQIKFALSNTREEKRIEKEKNGLTLDYDLDDSVSFEEDLVGIPVVVASCDISEETKITKENVEIRYLLKKELPANPLSNYSDVLDRTTKEKLVKGQPVLNIHIGPRGFSGLADNVPQGWRAVNITTSSTAGLGGYIRPDNRVDVSMVIEAKDKVAIMPILSGVKILAVNERVEGEVNQREKLSSLTLLVTPNEAARFNLAKEKAKLQLVLCDSQDPRHDKRLAREKKGIEGLDPDDLNVTVSWKDLVGHREESPIRPAVLNSEDRQGHILTIYNGNNVSKHEFKDPSEKSKSQK